MNSKKLVSISIIAAPIILLVSIQFIRFNGSLWFLNVSHIKEFQNAIDASTTTTTLLLFEERIKEEEEEEDSVFDKNQKIKNQSSILNRQQHLQEEEVSNNSSSIQQQQQQQQQQQPLLLLENNNKSKNEYTPPKKTIINNNNNIIINVGPGTTGTHGTYDALCQLGIPSIHWGRVCLSTTKFQFLPRLSNHQTINNRKSTSNRNSNTATIQQQTTTNINTNATSRNEEMLRKIYKTSIQFHKHYNTFNALIHNHLFRVTKKYTKNKNIRQQQQQQQQQQVKPMPMSLMEYFANNNNNNKLNLNNIDVRQWQQFVKQMFKEQLTLLLPSQTSNSEYFIKSFHDIPYYNFIPTMIETINEIHHQQQQHHQHQKEEQNNYYTSNNNKQNWNIFFINTIRDPYKWAIRRIQTHRVIVCKDNLDEIDLDECINRAVNRLNNTNSFLSFKDVFYSIRSPKASWKKKNLRNNETKIQIYGAYDNNNNNKTNVITLQDLINGLRNGMIQHQERVKTLGSIFSNNDHTNTNNTFTVTSNLYPIDFFSNNSSRSKTKKESTKVLANDLLKQLVFYTTKYDNNNNNNVNSSSASIVPSKVAISITPLITQAIF